MCSIYSMTMYSAEWHFAQCHCAKCQGANETASIFGVKHLRSHAKTKSKHNIRQNDIYQNDILQSEICQNDIWQNNIRQIDICQNGNWENDNMENDIWQNDSLHNSQNCDQRTVNKFGRFICHHDTQHNKTQHTLSKTKFNTMTLSIKGLFTTLSIKDTQHKCHSALRIQHNDTQQKEIICDTQHK